MSTYPKVSVVIPVYNSEATIGACVESVLKQDYPNFDVIAVDDASTDRSASVISALPCKLVRLDKNSGPAIARNRGADEAGSCEIVAFIDADCEAPPMWLKKIADNFASGGIGAVSGGYKESVSREPLAMFQYYDTAYRQRNIPRYIRSCVTSNFASKKDVFMELGGFPPKRINEDMEFGLLLGSRYKILWDKENGVSHKFNGSMAHYFIEQIKWAESAVLTYLYSPVSVLERNTWDNSEIILDLFSSILLYASVAGILFDARFAFLAVTASLLYIIFNLNVIKFVAKKEGYLFALRMPSLTLVRNTAWLLGILKALGRFGFNFFKKEL